MFKDLCDTINPGDNVIIALGDSFTQGIGAYSLQSWEASSKLGKPSRFNITGEHYREEQHNNNWANQLRNTYFPDYKVWNLGINGSGNRATIKELYLNPLPKKLGNVVVILMATGIERFDFLKSSLETAGKYNHQKWQTIWPIDGNRGGISVIEKVYAELLYSNKVVAMEFLLNVGEAQNYCKAHNYKFVFTSAFDESIKKETLLKYLDDDPEHIDIVNWDDFYMRAGHSFSEIFCQSENNPNFKTFGEYQQYVQKLTMPLKYMTPCMHWTIEGQKMVANYLAKELIRRKLV